MSEMWVVNYDNDTGPSDEGFSEWWTVDKGDISYKSWNEDHAKKLASVLNLIDRCSEMNSNSDKADFSPESDSFNSFNVCHQMGIADGVVQFARSLKLLFEMR